MSVGSSLMGALQTSFAELRQRIEGEPGRRIAALGHGPSVVAELCRHILGALADAFAWLAHALEDAMKSLRTAEALIALVEVAMATLDGLAEGLLFGDMPRALGLPTAPFEHIDSALVTARAALAEGSRLTGYAPSSDDIRNVRAELGKLLGRRANPELQDDGALGRLLAAIAPA